MIRFLAFAGAVVLVCAACARGPAGAGDGRLEVVASFYPLAFAAQRVGGDRVTVRDLTPPGAEPHDLELTPGDVDVIRRADLVVYLSGEFQSAIEEAVSSAPRALDVLSVARPLLRSTEGSDPHVWQDPRRLTRIADAIAGELAAIDGEHGAEYRARARTFTAELAALDRAYATGLASCQRREIVTSHAAFGYFASRYGLRQIPIAGIDPEAEPTPRRLDEAVKAVARYKATTVFTETLVSPKIAETVAREADARTDVLDPVEGARPGETYISIMRRNLERLRRALECA